jgi:chemotaxis protein MotB
MPLDDDVEDSATHGAIPLDHSSGKNHDHHAQGHAEDHGESHHEEGEEGEGPWLLSYADMVTLLMCFFILFFQTDKSTGKFNEPQKLLARLKTLVSDEVEDEKSDDQPPPTLENAPSSVALDTVFALGHTSPDTVELVLLTNNMFLPGSAEMTGSGYGTLEAVAVNIKTMPSNSIIEIEGHTDSVPINNGKFKDNWELSSGRATAVLRVLEKKGIPANRMRVIGLAHFHPLVPEKDSRGFPILSNQAINRRIVIRLRMGKKSKG